MSTSNIPNEPNDRPAIQMVHDRTAGAKYRIYAFMNCGKCIDEWKANGHGESPATFSRLSVGLTPKGIQIWCVRHDCNVDDIEMRVNA